MLARLLGMVLSRGAVAEAVFAARILGMALQGDTHLARAIAGVVQGIDAHDYAMGLAERPVAAPERRRLSDRAA